MRGPISRLGSVEILVGCVAHPVFAELPLLPETPSPLVGTKSEERL